MSTNNFKFDNILIVLPDFNLYNECDECYNLDIECVHNQEVVDFDDFSYNEYIADVQSQLGKIGFDSCDKWDNDRNYNGKIIAGYGLEDKTGMIVWLEVVIRNGYYGGANIDYTIDGDFGIENEQNKKDIAHYEAMHRKLDRMIAKTEKILRKNGTEMLKVGQFSNGEAVYKLKNKKDEKTKTKKSN
jgi:hypothetical protein